MLSISTISEALSFLSEETGRTWTDSEIFDIAVNNQIKMHASAPIDSTTTIQEIVGGAMVEKMRLPAPNSSLAVLFPWQVGQLWISGETKTSHPSDHDRMQGEYKLFIEPVRVTRTEVRISAASLLKILEIWHKNNPTHQDQREVETTTIIERRKQAILIAVNAKGWDAQKIPDGGKAEIKKICCLQPALFTDSTFDAAWKKTDVRMLNHEKFTSKK